MNGKEMNTVEHEHMFESNMNNNKRGKKKHRPTHPHVLEDFSCG